MRFSLLNVCLVFTIICLCGMLITTQNPRTIRIETYWDTWNFQENHLKESQWSDKSTSPPIPLTEAYRIANEFVSNIPSETQEGGHYELEVVQLTLQRFDLWTEDCWAYHVHVEGTKLPAATGLNSVTQIGFFILMDGSIHTDIDHYDYETLERLNIVSVGREAWNE